MLLRNGSICKSKTKDPSSFLKVTNQGSPISAGMLESIFEPLVYHHHQTPSEPSKGLGLGLFIVREIAKAHGGTVQVSSSASEGTTFSVRLPRCWRPLSL